VHDEFVEKLKKGLDKYINMGDPMDEKTTIGPLINQKAKDNLIKQVKQSVDNGAKIIYGGLDYKMTDSNLKDGSYFHPLILDNVTKNQPAYCEELFGPVFSLFKFRQDLEAVEIANDN
jgi:succinate-semialdehyde dehydrogenase/glutarate-semialdehyde dehydrogenase